MSGVYGSMTIGISDLSPLGPAHFHLVSQPFSFQQAALGGRDNLMPSLLKQIVQERPDRYEPAAFFAQPGHQLRKPPIEHVAIVESAGEVSIHDACSAFGLQLVLSLLAQSAIE